MPPKKAIATTKAPKRVAAKQTTNLKASSPSKSRLAVGKSNKTGTSINNSKTSAKANVTGAKGKGKSKDGKGEPSVKQWSKNDQQARVIQTAFRKYLAKKKLESLKKRKQDYEELMVKLEKEAWLQMVQRGRDEEEKERKKEEVVRKRRAQETKWKKQLLEAAFDGDNNEILAVLDEVQSVDKKCEGLSDVVKEMQIKKHQLTMVDCEDANGNTPLSEASAGGHVKTIEMLLERGAEINSRGHYDRTPLWRAAFAGHVEAVKVLLDSAGDPRLHASDGTNPEQVAAIPDVEEMLKTWNIEETDALLRKMEEEKENRIKSEKQEEVKECTRLEKDINQAVKEDEACQKLLEKAHSELNKRIFEHDNCTALGDENKIKITLQTVHDAETELEKAKYNSNAACDNLSQLKLKLREQRKEKADGMDTEELPGIKVSIRELDDVLFRDVGGKIAESGRWPFVIDSSSQTATFLRYRDTNYINALNPTHVEPEVIRLAILGALRFGKPLVLDMMAVDMFESVTLRFDQVQEGLMTSIMSKDILKEDRYSNLSKNKICLMYDILHQFLSLVQPGDGEEYSKTSFLGARIENFKFIILTQLWNPNENLIKQTYPLRVMIHSQNTSY